MLCLQGVVPAVPAQVSTPGSWDFVPAVLPATITLVPFSHLTSVLPQRCPTWEWQHLTQNSYGCGLWCYL